MTVSIPVEYQQFVEHIIRSGSFHSEAEVVSEALRLLKKCEQLRASVLAAGGTVATILGLLKGLCAAAESNENHADAS